MPEISLERCHEILTEVEVAHLGTIIDSEPYVSPVFFVLFGDRIVFRTRPGPRLDAVLKKPDVCVTVTRFDELMGEWEAVTVWGTASVVTDPGFEAEVAALFVDKYRASSWPIPEMLPGEAVVTVSIGRLAGHRSGDGLGPIPHPARRSR